MSLVFQYGSNTSFEKLNSKNRLNGKAKLVGLGVTKEKYELDFTVFSKSNNCAAADIVPGGSVNIWGVLYEVPDKYIFRDSRNEITTLDSIEGEGKNYKRIKIDIISSNILLPSIWTYVVREKLSGLKTSEKYALEIINGLKSHNVDIDYLRYVYECILNNNPNLTANLPPLVES